LHDANNPITTTAIMARPPKTEDAGGSGSGISHSTSELPHSSQEKINASGSSSNNGPLFPSVSDPQVSYTLPQWLVPERYKDKQHSQNTPQTRVFSIPLPEVPTKTRQAVRAFLVKHHSQQKSNMKDSERKLKELKAEEKQAAAKAKAAKDKLAQALFFRSEKLKEIRKAHEVGTNKAMEELEKRMREERQKEELELEEKIKEDCKLEYEKKFEEEMIHKRKREQEEDEKEEVEAASAAKKARENKEGASGGDGGKNRASSSTKVQLLEQKQKDLKMEMEKLCEKKSEMVWLLKQVIMQEATINKTKKGKTK